MLEGDTRVGKTTRDLIVAEANDDGVLVPAISIWEIGMLAARNRVEFSLPVEEWVDAALALPGFRLEPLSPGVALACHMLPGDFHKDPADRMIVATARHHGIELVTADEAILAYAEAGHVAAIDARV